MRGLCQVKNPRNWAVAQLPMWVIQPRWKASLPVKTCRTFMKTTTCFYNRTGTGQEEQNQRHSRFDLAAPELRTASLIQDINPSLCHREITIARQDTNWAVGRRDRQSCCRPASSTLPEGWPDLLLQRPGNDRTDRIQCCHFSTSERCLRSCCISLTEGFDGTEASRSWWPH